MKTTVTFCILVATVSLMSNVARAGDWKLYDDFNDNVLDGGRWSVPDGFIAPQETNQELKFLTSSLSYSYVMVATQNVSGIRADLQLSSNTTSCDGGIELYVSAADVENLQAYFELDFDGTSSSFDAEIEGPGETTLWETAEIPYSLDQVYDMAIVVRDDDRLDFYTNGQLFATSDAITGLTTSIVNFAIGTWNEDATVEAYADNVQLITKNTNDVIVITSFQGNGELSWSNSVPDRAYRLEWKSSLSPLDPWHSSWASLNYIPDSGEETTTTNVPMFYRVVLDPNDVTGTWSVQQTQLSETGEYTSTLIISQIGSNVVGTAVFDSETGTVTGVRIEDEINLKIEWNSGCTTYVHGMIRGNSITPATWVDIDGDGGTWSAEKQ